MTSYFDDQVHKGECEETERVIWYEDLLIPFEQISEGLLNDMVEAANHWPTCACGHTDKDIDRDGDGKPDDDVLIRLGLQFSAAVGTMQSAHGWGLPTRFEDARKEAIETMKLINQRAQQLIDLKRSM